MAPYTSKQLDNIKRHERDMARELMEIAGRNDVAMLRALQSYKRAVVSTDRHVLMNTMHKHCFPGTPWGT